VSYATPSGGRPSSSLVVIFGISYLLSLPRCSEHSLIDFSPEARIIGLQRPDDKIPQFLTPGGFGLPLGFQRPATRRVRFSAT